MLGLVSNWLAAGLLAFTIFFYAVIYSMWLKRSTPQNIVIGGAAGALPAGGGAGRRHRLCGLESLVLFAIIFIWTPPHFWALALVKSGDYARAGIPMMPNVAGPDSTRRQILAYTVLLAPLGLARSPSASAASPMRDRRADRRPRHAGARRCRSIRLRQGEPAMRVAQQLFGFSILYLFLLFATLLAEHGFGFFRPVFG